LVLGALRTEGKGKTSFRGAPALNKRTKRGVQSLHSSKKSTGCVDFFIKREGKVGQKTPVQSRKR